MCVSFLTDTVETSVVVDRTAEDPRGSFDEVSDPSVARSRIRKQPHDRDFFTQSNIKPVFDLRMLF